MAKTIDVLEYIKKQVIFNNLALENKLDKYRSYINLVLYRLNKSGRIYKIERDKYTVYGDPFLISSHILWPSYISGWSALRYHNLTEQIPNHISIVAIKNKRAIKFINTSIIFKKVKKQVFFGYEKIKYSNFEVFIANPEKAIIDSALLGLVSVSEAKEIFLSNIKKISITRLLIYLKKIGNKSLIKRVGYLLDISNKECYKKLKKHIDATYIPLDNSKKNIGTKNKK